MPTRRALLQGAATGILAMHMGRELNALETTKSQLALDFDEVVWLSSNLNPLGPSPKAIAAIQSNLNESYRYGDPPALTFVEKLHQFHGIPFNDTSDPKVFFQRYDAFRHNPIRLSFGCTELLKNAAMAFGDNGGEYIESFPTYNRIGSMVKRYSPNMKRVQVPVNEVHQTDLSAIQAAITKNTRFIYLVNPGNPTGTVIDPKELIRFYNNLPENIILIMDESYIELAPPESTVSLVQLASQRDNLLVFRTFSKVYGLAGLRIGYAVGPNALLDQMDRFSDGASYQNFLSMVAASAALDDTAFVTESVAHANRIKQQMYQRFSDYGHTVYPSATNFIWVKNGRDNQEAVNTLRNRGIFIKDGNSYWNQPGYLRVSIGSDADMKDFYRHFEEVMGI